MRNWIVFSKCLISTRLLCCNLVHRENTMKLNWSVFLITVLHLAKIWISFLLGVFLSQCWNRSLLPNSLVKEFETKLYTTDREGPKSGINVRKCQEEMRLNMMTTVHINSRWSSKLVRFLESSSGEACMDIFVWNGEEDLQNKLATSWKDWVGRYFYEIYFQHWSWKAWNNNQFIREGSCAQQLNLKIHVSCSIISPEKH